MKINASAIEKFNPCKDRFDNFKSQYPDFDGSLYDFIRLENITYQDKVWVITRMFTKQQNVAWSILCVESVLHLLEEKYPSFFWRNGRQGFFLFIPCGWVLSG